MCLFKAPKIPKTPPPAQMQSMQAPKDMINNKHGSMSRLRRRGMWASVMTGPSGVSGPPTVTGAGGSVTGG
jgi:hypothetical protein